MNPEERQLHERGLSEWSGSELDQGYVEKMVDGLGATTSIGIGIGVDALQLTAAENLTDDPDVLRETVRSGIESAGPMAFFQDDVDDYADAFTDGVTEEGIEKAKGAAVMRQIDEIKEGELRIAMNTPDDLDVFQRGFRGFVDSTARMTPGLAALLVSRSSAPLLATMGAGTYFDSYGKCRAAGVNPSICRQYADADGAIEVLTEVGPAKLLAGVFKEVGEKGVKNWLKKYIVQDMAREQVAELSQSMNANAYGLDEELENAKTLKEKIDIMAERQIVVAIATSLQAGVVGGGLKGIEVLSRPKKQTDDGETTNIYQKPDLPDDATPDQRSDAAVDSFIENVNAAELEQAGFVDWRLNHIEYQHIEDFVEASWVKGGGIEMILDDMGRPLSRSISVNPDWVQGLISDGWTKQQLQKEVKKSLNQERLTERQTIAVQVVLDAMETPNFYGSTFEGSLIEYQPIGQPQFEEGVAPAEVYAGDERFLEIPEPGPKDSIQWADNQAETREESLILQAVEQKVGSWNNAPNVRVVQSVTDIPGKHPERARGAWIDGDVVLFADNIGSEQEAMTVLLHEIVGHHGLRAILGSKLDEVLDKVYEGNQQAVEEIAAERGLDLEDVDQRREAAEEFIAETAENPPEAFPGWLNGLITRIRNALRKLGFDVAEWGRPEVVDLIRQSMRRFEGEQLVNIYEGGVRYDPEYSMEYDPTDPRYSFAGSYSATANMDDLGRAMSMHDAKRSMNVIRRETGWFKGVDGQWRYEISDEGARLTDEFQPYLRSGKKTDEGNGWTSVEGDESAYWKVAYDEADRSQGNSITVGVLLEHDKLFSAYPELRDITVSAHDGRGATYFDNASHISVGREVRMSDFVSILLHELQHAIQSKESFAQGGSADRDWTDTIKSALNIFTDQLRAEADAWRSAYSTLIEDESSASEAVTNGYMFKSMKKLLDYANHDRPSSVFRHIRNEMQWIYNYNGDKVANELQYRFWVIPKRHNMAKRNAFLEEMALDAAHWIRSKIPEGALERMESDERTVTGMLRAFEREYGKARDSLAPLREMTRKQDAAAHVAEAHKFGTPFDVYQALAGEIEARNVQSRKDMTEEERQSTPPEQTADVPAENAIVLVGGMNLYVPEVQHSIRYSTKPEQEMTAVRDRYFGTPEWMLAPNGEVTNLNPHQWVQVRTPSFIKWFGPFEENARYDSLIRLYESGGGDVAEVLDRMTGATLDSKILDPVISSIPVNVVNDLGGVEIAAKMLLHDPSVLVDISARGSNSDIISLASRFMLASESVVAFTRAKLSFSKPTAANAEMLSALDALQNNLVAVVGRLATRGDVRLGETFGVESFFHRLTLAGVGAEFSSALGFGSVEGGSAFSADGVVPDFLRGNFTMPRTEFPSVSDLGGLGVELDPALLAGSLHGKDYTADQEYVQSITNASKVVDENGEPLVVYHGTEMGGFGEFDEYEQGANTSNVTNGFYFTESLQNAATYSGSKNEIIVQENVGQEDEFGYEIELDPQAGIYSLFVNLREPVEVDFGGRSWDGSKEGEYDEESDFLTVPTIENDAFHAGADGAIIDNVVDEGEHGQGYNWGEKTYIVFRPENIKSAIANRGTFDLADPRILYSIKKGKEVGASLQNSGTTDSKEFSDWFGNSKVVGGDGAPIVVHHGTVGEFDEFEPSKRLNGAIAGSGFYFTEEEYDAEYWAVRAANGVSVDTKIISGYLSISNPLIIESDLSISSIIEALPSLFKSWIVKEYGHYHSDSVNDALLGRDAFLEGHEVDDWAAENLTEYAEGYGYDGLSYNYDGNVHWVAYSASQFKSTDNSGAFDPSDNRFRYSLRPDRQAQADAAIELGKGVIRGYFGAMHESVRKIGVPAARRIADMVMRPLYYENSTEQGALNDMVSRLSDYTGRYGSRLSEILEEHKGRFGQLPRQISRDLVRSLHSGETPVSLENTARELRQWLDDLQQYQIDAGVDLGYVTNYFPRVYDVEKIMRNATAFQNMLMENGWSKESAGRTYRRIIRTDGIPEMQTDTSGRIDIGQDEEIFTQQRELRTEGGIVKAGHMRERKIDLPYESLEPWLHNDLHGVLGRYMSLSIKRAEYARSFGSGEGRLNHLVRQMVTEMEGEDYDGTTDIRTAVRMVYDWADMMQGVHKMDGIMTNRLAAGTQRFFLNAMVLLHMSYSALSSVPEFFTSGALSQSPKAHALGMLSGVAHAAHEATAVASRLITGKRLVDKTAWTRAAEDAGIIQVQALQDAIGHLYGTRTSRVTSAYMKGTLLESMTRMQKVAAFKTFHVAARDWAASQNPHSVQMMKDFGLDPAAMQQWAEQGYPEDSEIVEQINRSAVRFGITAVTTPNVATRSAWFQDPRLATFFQFQGFINTFSNSFLKRIIVQMKRGEGMQGKLGSLPFLVLMVAAAYAMQEIRDWFKYGEGRKPYKQDEWQRMTNAIDRAGLTGNTNRLYEFFWPYRYAYYDSTYTRFGNLFGPLIGDALRTGDVIMSDSDQRKARHLTKMIPVVNAIPEELGRDEIEKQMRELIR